MSKKVVIDRQWFITSKVTDINADYTITQEIGTGTYGKVYLAQDRASLSLRAIKVIQKLRIEDYDSFVNEINILKRLDHPNIVNIIETYENERVCFLVLEHCRGGELFERLLKKKTFSEAQASVIMKQLISAVSYCHNHGICHRDLKPENCLYVAEDENSEIKVIDFGLSAKLTEEDILHDIQGTPYYMAPEVLSKNYTKAVDLWSLGVILYMLLSGTPPFNGSDNNEILMSVFNGSFSFRPKIFKKISDSAKDLICRLLTKDPEYRLTAQQAFNHPWIQNSQSLPQVELPSSLLDSMRRFSEANTLKRASLMFIATKLTEADIKNIRNHFKSIDVNGDGVISMQELEKVIRKTQDIPEENWQIVVSSLDANDNGEIDYSEFLSGCLLRRSFTTSGFFESAFKHFDKDNSGFISPEEIKSVLTRGEVVVGLDEETIHEIVQGIDKNSDGLIDYREFIDMMSQKSFLPKG